MALADSWYTSGTLWTAAGPIAVLLVGAISIYVALALANTVRCLECAMSAAPLLRESAQDMPGQLSITWDGIELRDPSILEVNLVNRGRRDIAGEDFDQPLEFRVGARILAILRTASGPNSTAFRTVAFEDDLLKVGPGLIRQHQSIKFTLLASGRDPVLSSSAAAVRDVDVKVLPTEQSASRHWSARTKVAAILGGAAVTAGLVLIGLLIGHIGSPHETPTGKTAPPPVLQPAMRILTPGKGALLHGNQNVLIEGTAKGLADGQIWVFILREGAYFVSNSDPIAVVNGQWHFVDPYVGSSSDPGNFQIDAVLGDASCTTAINSAKQQPGGGVAFKSLPRGGCFFLRDVSFPGVPVMRRG
jgi:hypothetical protein